MSTVILEERKWLYCKWHLVRVWFYYSDGKWLCECHNKERVA